MLVYPYLSRPQQGFQASSSDYLKVFLFAHDNLIQTLSSIVNWVGEVKILLEEKEFALIIRSLRYLKFKGEDTILDQISILLLNTLNKMLIDSNCKRKEISFVLQVTKLLNLKEINENNLLKLLRSEKVNDRMKAMVIKLQDLYDFNEVSRMLGEKTRSAIITSALNEKFEDFKESENHKNLSCSKLINLINGNHKSFSEAEQAILEERKDIVGLGFNNAYEQYIGILSGHAIDITDPNSLRYLLKADKISWKDFMNRIQTGNLTSIDYELIAMKTCDPELFWSSLNNISFMIFPEDSIEIKLYMLEYMNNKDIKSYNLPAQLYFFKLLNGKFEGPCNTHILMVRFATICASNMNRSMEAHHVLSKKGFEVCSFGTNSQVKMPGPTADRPNTYSFGQSYEHIYNDLKGKDSNLYTQNGLLSMLERNKKIKNGPQRFQSSNNPFDVIFTCEERCFDIVCEDLREREIKMNRAVHVINFDIPDTPEDAAIGARMILQLAQLIEDKKGEGIEESIEEFQSKCNLPMLYTILYY